VLDACSGVQRVGSFVMGIDDYGGSAAGDAAGVAGIDAGSGRSIDGLQSCDPAVLGEVVVVKTEAGADYCVSGLAGRIGDAEAWADGFAVVVSYSVNQRNA
jgi:hypothetical protein